MTTLDNEKTMVDESTVPFLPTALRYGLIGGLIFIIYSLISNISGLSLPSSLTKVAINLAIATAISIGFIVITIKHHRENQLGGFISFKRAFLVSFVALLIATLISSLFSLIYALYIDPNQVDNIIAATEEMMTNLGAPEADIENQIEKMKTDMTPIGMLKQGLQFGAIGGALFSLICSAIMKRVQPIF